MEQVIQLPLMLLLLYSTSCHASRGDTSQVHRNHLRLCLNLNCGTPEKLEAFASGQPLHLKLLAWDCHSECRYSSMWKSVDDFIRNQLPIPQFYGKWPFVRLFGIQEPASVVFSIGNGLGQVYFWYQLRSRVPNTAPMYYACHLQIIVALNAWLWSTVFHTRDLIWTEMMDYFSAYSVVLSNLFMVSIRVLAYRDMVIDKRIAGAIAAVVCFVYCRHIYFLGFIHFDYGYNMKVNITTATFSFLCWIVWSLWNIRRQPYLWKAIVSIVGVNITLALELLDFPPIWWTFDAHALWHASTIPISLLWTSFYIDDCLYLHHSTVKLKKGV